MPREARHTWQYFPSREECGECSTEKKNPCAFHLKIITIMSRK